MNISIKKIGTLIIFIVSIIILSGCNNSEQYIARFIDWDDSLIEEITVNSSVFENIQDLPNDPIREGYSFNKWTSSFDSNTNVIIAKATYTINTYTVIWKNHDGSILETNTNVEYGTTPSYDGTTPVKTADAQYSYTFSGWSPSISNVTGDKTYTAQFSTSSVKTYKVTWKNWDGTVLENDTNVEYGTTPSYDGTTPVKTADAQYSYTFSGWSPSISNVTGDKTYTAQFSTSSVKTYKVTWKNWDGTTLKTDTNVAYGTTPSYDKTTPVKTADAQYSYTFSGWSPSISNVTGDKTYTAQFSTSSVKTYKVTWKNWDGTVLENDTNVEYGTTPSYDGTTPVKTADAQYSYTFSGWSPSISNVTGDKTYTAQFSTSSVKTYKVTWKNWDGTVLENDTNVEYGTTPSYDGTTPVKTADAQYSYTFSGWSPSISNVTGDKTYTAQFSTSSVKTYKVTWKNWDGTTLKTDTNVAYGTTPSYDKTTPVKTADAQYSYTFSGWSPSISNVTGDKTYTAQFTTTVKSYTITWKNWDGTTLKTDTNVAYGTTPSYDKTTPVKTADAQYSYTFSGWLPSISNVTGDKTYTALFTTHSRYTRIDIDQSQLVMNVGDKYVITYTAYPLGAGSVTLNSTDSSMISISDDFEVTALKPGQTTIYIESDNGLRSECNVYVFDIEIDMATTLTDWNYITVGIGGSYSKRATVTINNAEFYMKKKYLFPTDPLYVNIHYLITATMTYAHYGMDCDMIYHFKLYDPDGLVVETGTIYSETISVGETTNTQGSRTIKNPVPGIYKIVFYEDNN